MSTSTLRRSKRAINPPERFGFEEATPSVGLNRSECSGSVRVDAPSVQSNDSSVSLVRLPDGRYKSRAKMIRSEIQMEKDLNIDQLDEFVSADAVRDQFFENPGDWMSSDSEDDISRPEEKVHLKKNDLVKFLHDGEIVQARVIHVTNKMAQVRINLGEVLWKAKKSLTYIRN